MASSEHSSELRVADPRRSNVPRSPMATRRTRRETNEENVPLVNRKPPRPPLASTEMDDMDDDEREVVSRPYPGVDDGFFNGQPNNGDYHTETNNTDVEMIPPSDPNGQDEEIPEITPRAGPDGETDTDETDGSKKPGPGSDQPLVPHFRPDQQPPGRFPYVPGYGTDLEIGSIMPPDDASSLPDFNVYQHKKTLAQGMMDLALFSANANQLRYVLESYSRHPYYYPSLILISISLVFQIGVGIGLIWNATYNVKDDKQICLANRINNFTVIGIFLVTVVNVFISAFGVADMTPNVVTTVTAVVPAATPGAG